MSLEALPQNPPALISVDSRRSKEALEAIKQVRRKIKPQPEFNFKNTADQANQTLDLIRNPKEVTPTELKDTKVPKGVQRIVKEYNRLKAEYDRVRTLEISPEAKVQAGFENGGNVQLTIKVNN